jgi:hypothetical protein
MSLMGHARAEARDEFVDGLATARANRGRPGKIQKRVGLIGEGVREVNAVQVLAAYLDPPFQSVGGPVCVY